MGPDSHMIASFSRANNLSQPYTSSDVDIEGSTTEVPSNGSDVSIRWTPTSTPLQFLLIDPRTCSLILPAAPRKKSPRML